MFEVQVWNWGYWQTVFSSDSESASRQMLEMQTTKLGDTYARLILILEDGIQIRNHGT